MTKTSNHFVFGMILIGARADDTRATESIVFTYVQNVQLALSRVTSPASVHLQASIGRAGDAAGQSMMGEAVPRSKEVCPGYREWPKNCSVNRTPVCTKPIDERIQKSRVNKISQQKK
ncbi:jg20113 [Pararge aegeria aegeria]|uniref:Jg20113 protein n=1 Tax=Pararge aegeria aegeria TaxID=348720 RepID=A0A8S4RIR9_9NEOP|nr:jg20113 [Pararge aegeria aegeria]